MNNSIKKIRHFLWLERNYAIDLACNPDIFMELLERNIVTVGPYGTIFSGKNKTAKQFSKLMGEVDENGFELCGYYRGRGTKYFVAYGIITKQQNRVHIDIRQTDRTPPMLTLIVSLLLCLFILLPKTPITLYETIESICYVLMLNLFFILWTAINMYNLRSILINELKRFAKQSF